MQVCPQICLLCSRTEEEIRASACPVPSDECKAEWWKGVLTEKGKTGRPSLNPSQFSAPKSRMATISTALRNFKEPSKDQIIQTFFSIPSSTTHNVTIGVGSSHKNGDEEEVDKMEINAVLSLGEQNVEDSYVRFSCSPECATDTDTGWETIYHCTLPGIHLIGSQIC